MNKFLTFDERKIIEKKIEERLSLTQISRFIGRSSNGVITEVRKNGGRENYNAIKAQKKSELIRNLRNEKAAKTIKNIGYNPFVYLSQKIEILEMQLEIIIEKIKEITKNGN